MAERNKEYGAYDLHQDILKTDFTVRDEHACIPTMLIDGRTVPLKLDTASHFLLVQIAGYVTRKTNYSWTLLLSTLAKACHMDEKTVRRKLALLEAMKLIVQHNRTSRSSRFVINVAYIRPLAAKQRAERKAEREAAKAQDAAELAALAGDAAPAIMIAPLKVSPSDDTLILDAPPMHPPAKPRPALIEALRRIDIDGESLPDRDAETVAASLMKKLPDHEANICAIANLTPENIASLAKANSRPGWLVRVLADSAADLAVIEPDADMVADIPEWIDKEIDEVRTGQRTGTCHPYQLPPRLLSKYVQAFRDAAGQTVIVGDLEYVPGDDNDECRLGIRLELATGVTAAASVPVYDFDDLDDEF